MSEAPTPAEGSASGPFAKVTGDARTDDVERATRQVRRIHDSDRTFFTVGVGERDHAKRWNWPSLISVLGLALCALLFGAVPAVIPGELERLVQQVVLGLLVATGVLAFYGRFSAKARRGAWVGLVVLLLVLVGIARVLRA